MADHKSSRLSTVSPLFHKMDAFLARHRAPVVPDIPVLTEEAADILPPPIPVLTRTVADEGLMFDPREFHSYIPTPRAPELTNRPPAPKPEVNESVFLDLPMLDLDAFASKPAVIRDPFDLDLDIDERCDAIPPAPKLQSPILNKPPAPKVWPASAEPPARKPVSAPVSSKQNLPILEEEAVPLLPPDAFSPEPVTMIPDDILRSLELPEIVLASDAPHVEVEVEEVIELVSMPDEDPFMPESGPVLHMELAPEPELNRMAEPVLAARDEVVREPESELSLIEPPAHPPIYLTLEQEEEPAVVAVAETVAVAEAVKAASPPVAPKLSDAAISEITASVAAQIAVEVSTEVAQLTRQHFASMMNSFYSDSLRKLTDEISRDMEDRLGARIEALVHRELKREGLVE